MDQTIYVATIGILGYLPNSVTYFEDIESARDYIEGESQYDLSVNQSAEYNSFSSVQWYLSGESDDNLIYLNCTDLHTLPTYYDIQETTLNELGVTSFDELCDD